MRALAPRTGKGTGTAAGSPLGRVRAFLRRRETVSRGLVEFRASSPSNENSSSKTAMPHGRASGNDGRWHKRFKTLD